MRHRPITRSRNKPAGTPLPEQALPEHAPPETAPRESARAKRRRQQAAIIVDLATALGMSNEPGFIPGYGWVPADIAREIAAESQEWSRWLIDDTSRIAARHQQHQDIAPVKHCVASSPPAPRSARCPCAPDRPATPNSTTPMTSTGRTPPQPTCIPACGPDHLIVTAGYFLVTLDEHGQATWTSTTSGHSYDTCPRRCSKTMQHRSPTMPRCPRSRR